LAHLGQFSPQRYDFSHVTIGVLTALEEEYAACKGILDPDKNGIELEKRATSGTLTCWLCSIPARFGGTHIVAITRTTGMGNTASAIAANILFQHCEAIQFLIMCGIAGAVPNSSNHEQHVRLGDIVVSGSPGIVQYDFGKLRDARRVNNDLFSGFEFRLQPRPPCPKLLAAVGRMHSDERLLSRDTPREWERKIESFLSRLDKRTPWKRPAPKSDVLIDTVDGTGAQTQHPRDPERRRGKPRVFRGAIGAANIVLADPKKRDELRNRHGIKAVEMEGFGVADASWLAGVGYLVVRGTCDYWHSYAALVAAAYARTVIEYLHPSGMEGTDNFPSAATVPDRDTLISTQLQLGESRASNSTASSTPGKTFTDTTEVRSVSHQASPTEILVPSIEGDVAPRSSVELNFGQASDTHGIPPQYRRINQLAGELETIVETGRLKDAEPIAVVLEQQLEPMPRLGSIVRAGWLALGRLEVLRLRLKNRSGSSPDLARLRHLRQEAEGVID
jgi:nucleoside phosphorylase